MQYALYLTYVRLRKIKNKFTTFKYNLELYHVDDGMGPAIKYKIKNYFSYFKDFDTK